jgi:hypothetical protein
MQAPAFVISVTAHERTPLCSPKNSNASLTIFVLPIDLRSFISITRLDEPLVDPAAAVIPPPDFSVNELAANGPSWNDDRPKMPDLCPTGFRLLAPYLELII